LELKPHPQPRCFQITPLAGGVESKILFHAKNKKAVAIGTHATWEAGHRGGPDAASTAGRRPSLTALKFARLRRQRATIREVPVQSTSR